MPFEIPSFTIVPKMNFKKLAAIPVFLLGLFICFQLTRSIAGLWRGGGRVEDLQREVWELEEEKKLLEQKKAYYQTPEFVEEQARNKLQMTKEGERVVILPRSVVEERGLKGLKEGEGVLKKGNWEKWVDYWWD